MKVCFTGIGQRVVTFVDEGVTAGKVCKVSANGKVDECASGDDFAGVALYAEGGFADVQLGGFVTVSYTGNTAPSVGWCKLSADATGGVAVDADGRSYLVVEVDTTGKTVGFFM